MAEFKKIALLFFIIISIILMPAENAWAGEVTEARFNLRLNPRIVRYNPEEFNDMIADVHDWANSLEDDLSRQMEAKLHDIAEDVYISIDKKGTTMHKDKFQYSPGIEGGMAYNTSRFPGNIYAGAGGFIAQSNMSGEVDGRLSVSSQEYDEDIDVEIEGDSENEVNFTLGNVALGYSYNFEERFDVLAALTYNYGEGEVYHRSEGDLEYTRLGGEDDENLDEVEDYLEKYDQGRVEYRADFELERSAGFKLGLGYNHLLTDELSLRAEGYYRWLEMKMKRQDVDYNEFDGDGELFRRYYRRQFDFELPATFEENMRGFEFSLGLNFSF